MQDRAYDIVNISRASGRAKASDWLDNLFDRKIILKGDRKYGEDSSVLAGIASLDGLSVSFVMVDKGRDTKERIEKNFGMPMPEGYRKAYRIMKQAEKFNRPIITFIDTPGAYPGVEAENRGQGEAIAKNILLMTSLRVPIVTVISGEACSGGALALAVSDYIFMLENSYYSILSPEGFSSILARDKISIEEVCERMKLRAQDLKEFGVIDEIVKEEDFSRMVSNMKILLKNKIIELSSQDKDRLLENRKNRFRKF
jgi:acetyl-CoA carboxylase carboxyl transferase alpha subunit